MKTYHLISGAARHRITAARHRHYIDRATRARRVEFIGPEDELIADLPAPEPDGADGIWVEGTEPPRRVALRLIPARRALAALSVAIPLLLIGCVPAAEGSALSPLLLTIVPGLIASAMSLHAACTP